MTLDDMLKIYGYKNNYEECEYYGNDVISIDGFCEEMSQTDIIKSSWYNDIKDRKIAWWQTIGGGMYKVEITIVLEEL